MTNPSNLDKITEVYGPATWDIYEKLDTSLDPRSPNALLDMAKQFAPANSTILDIGCRDGRHIIELSEVLPESSGLGLDPVPIHIERAQKALKEAGLTERFKVQEGVMQQVAVPDAHFDLIWCRDVIEQVDHLEDGLKEMRRVVKPGGILIAFTVFATDLLEPKEAEMLRHSKGNVWENLIEDDVEDLFQKTGFAIHQKEIIGTQWREFSEEKNQTVSKALLRLARLRRQEQAIKKEHGVELYQHVEANLHWEIYQFIGKLKPVVYVLKSSD